MKKFIFACFQAVRLCFPRTPGIRYYRHREGKFLYILASEKHIPHGEEFKMTAKLFSGKAEPISLLRFNFILCYYGTEIVHVADDEILDDYEADRKERQTEKQK